MTSDRKTVEKREFLSSLLHVCVGVKWGTGENGISAGSTSQR